MQKTQYNIPTHMQYWAAQNRKKQHHIKLQEHHESKAPAAQSTNNAQHTGAEDAETA